MKYEKLSKLFYKMDADSYEKECKKRTSSYGSYSTSLNIRGFRKGRPTDDSFELFYVNTHKLMKLNNEVLLNSSKISSLISQLPEFAAGDCTDGPYNQIIISMGSGATAALGAFDYLIRN